ncbi:AMP-binding protein [Erythrobacter sp. Alg231-14]|uniref:AMP-binding protein n=1 Tax=Erythrobacter sp. Alg231-14 TaxID=1922225 RepID=UPI000D54BB8E
MKLQDVLNEVVSELTEPGQPFELARAEVRGRKMKTWANAANSLRDIWLDTQHFAERDYLVFGEERWTYAQAHDQVARIANWLVSKGIGQHDRVAIAMRNYPEWMLSYWAIASIGAVAVGINAWWVAEELEYGLKDCDAKLLIGDAERLDRLSAIRERLPDLLVVKVRTEDNFDWATDWNDLLKVDPEMPVVTIDADDDVCIFYTSGTTGFPKGARLTHRGCANHLLTYQFVFASQSRAAAILNGVEPPDPSDANVPQPCAILATPLFHVTANNGLAHSLTANGGKLLHMFKWDAGEALRLIEQERVTSFSGVPTMARELVQHPDFSRCDLSSLSGIGGGGAAVPPDLIEKIDNVEHATTTIAPSTGYGLTESSGVVAAGSGPFLVAKPTSTGIALPVCEMKTIDNTGADLPTGEVGEICIFGAQVFKGYLNRPDATEETIVDGWLRTGDIGFIDADNYVHLVDRAKDMVLRGGENVYCSEVEAAIYRFPDVLECSVFSVPDERLGEEVGAAIFLGSKAEADVDELRSFLSTKIAAYKVPRYIWVMDTPLPRNANGKIVRRELQKTLVVDRAY